ncbi:FMN-dependent NADH-azoreductase [Rhodobacteraceae bacterium 2CG4]|uniref:FMN dependent NADH:quinone oxidoreductase n=1 Tax=Halovulum marinum TaxID=2662447 RepID=A0A6L5YWN0_9RHOB|nr:NAD(P)H-dependent oxidoreductase [Halovulum marinum]MSU88265.1 FMN-dependent NADH-azoreductase [Halovulum marinum]
MSKTLLIQSSARHDASVTRQLAEKLAEGLGDPVTVRDVSVGLPFVTEDWISARDAGTGGAVMQVSNELIDELRAHDAIVIAVPVYNFAIPATLKAWIDQVARAGETFRYTADGPEGLLTGKRAYLVVASGGMPVGSAWDHATPYLRHVLGFIGITDVEIVAADALGNDADKTLEAANAHIDALTRAEAA